MRQKYIWQDHDWVPIEKARPRNASKGPSVISDSIEVWSPFDGKTYDSKSRYFAEAKRRGLECIGNEKPTASPRPQMERPAETIKREMERNGW